MLAALRTATQTDHAALESGLGLLRRPLERSRFVQALQLFHSFHTGWEPRVAALIDDEALLGPRRRLPQIDRDLEALSAGAEARPFDLAFLADRSAAWGSLYVMEGSTLGGQVIGKALRTEAPWAPAGGLAYFDPHGRDTARMWRRFLLALEDAAPTLDEARAVQGARATFHALAQRCTPEWRAAA